MSKTRKLAFGGTALFALGAILINLIKQKLASEPGKEFDWKELMAAALKGAAVGASLGALIGAILDFRNAKEKPLDTDSYLRDRSKELELDKDAPAYVALDAKAQLLINLINQRYKGRLASEPCRLGSTEKGTALRTKFDIDIALRFKPGSFSSTEAMYFDLQACLEELIGHCGCTQIRSQKKSLGVLFDIEGQEGRIDVVPCKLTGGRTSGYLFVNEQGLFDEYSFTKTDIGVLNKVRFSKTQKDIIVILKDWKTRHDLPLSSHLLEQFVRQAYRCNLNIPKSITKKVIMVLKHIANNLDVMLVRGLENRNNVLNNISQSDKDKIIDACNSAIDDYEYQKNSIVETF